MLKGMQLLLPVAYHRAVNSVLLYTCRYVGKCEMLFKKIHVDVCETGFGAQI